MATKRTQKQGIKERGHSTGSISSEVNIQYGAVWNAGIILATIGIIIAVVLLSGFSRQVQSLRAFKDDQDKAISLIYTQCDSNLYDFSNTFDDGFNKMNCLDAISKAEKVGVASQVCKLSGSISIRATESKEDPLPSRSSDCDDVPSRIEAIEEKARKEKRKEDANSEIFNACNSRIKVRSAACSSAKAKYNYEWTYVGCDVYGYVVPSSEISGDVWNYRYFGDKDPHANESCYW